MAQVVHLYAVYDKVAKEFSAPNACKSDDVAVRQYQGLIQGLPAHVQADYELYRLADMDLEDGGIFNVLCEPVDLLLGKDSADA